MRMLNRRDGVFNMLCVREVAFEAASRGQQNNINMCLALPFVSRDLL